jgi:hypothetical protein
MRWQKGDLGRFESEDRALPRFEVIRAVKGEHVEVWYGGTTKTTLIPWGIFFKECTNLWDWKLDVTAPAWLVPGREFVASGSFIQARVRIKPEKWYQPSDIDQLYQANDARLSVRSVRHDHASCLVLPDGPLVIVNVVTAAACRRTTAWSRLLDNDVFEEDVDDLAEIIG